MENRMNDQKVNENRGRDYYTIDLGHMMQEIWRKAWLILLAGILIAAIAFSIAAFLIPPTYSSSVMLYVNNNKNTGGNTNNTITQSEITAAQSLVKTYSEILTNRTTLEKVIEKTGVPYSYKALQGMIKAVPANETEIMKVTVTTEDPYEAAVIANGIADVLPLRVEEIIEGSSMVVVEYAVPNTDKVAPNITKYTLVGFLIGVLIAIAFVVVTVLLDDRIHDEEYVLQAYECPILAKVPDLLDTGNKRYGYYYRYRTKKKTENQDDKGQVAE